MVAALRVVVLVLCLSVVPAAAARAPVLVLDPGWVHVVAPYRYEEVRRFEAGWNRGADVVPVGGALRAPIPGRVRFAGRVAGRLVVTADVELDGRRAVLTLTGLQNATIREGDRFAVGDVLGRGRLVHVGAYDPDRRSRYFEVAVAQSGGPLAEWSSAPRSPLADGVARRLHDAILGRADVVEHSPGHASVGAVDAASWGSVDAPGASSPRTAAPVAGGSAAADRARPASGSRADVQPIRLGGGRRTAASIDARMPPVAIQRGSSTSRSAPGGSAAGRSGAARGITAVTSTDTSTGATHAAEVERRAAAPAAPMVGDPGVAGASGRGPGSPRPSPGTRADRPGETGAAVPIAVGAGACLAALLALPLVRRRRIRRSRPRRAAPAPFEPLPVHLPHVRPYAYPVVRADGASVLADVALAWPDEDPGTGPEPDQPPTRAPARQPEHA